MEIGDVQLSSDMVQGALAAKNDNAAAQKDMAILRKALDNSEQAANALLKMMGIGQNLNVVG